MKSALNILERFAIIILFFGFLQGASLQVGSATIAPGGNGTIDVTLSTSGANIASLQFDITYDSSIFTITGEAGSAATNAGKELNSYILSGTEQRFMIIGFNQNLIGDGVVVRLNISVSSSALAANHALSLSDITASNAQGQGVNLTGTNGSIQISGGSNGAIGEITLTSPSDGLTYPLSYPPSRLEWNNVTNATSYDVYLERGDTSPDQKVASDITKNYWDISSGISLSGTYYWRVLVKNGSESKWSKTWNFILLDSLDGTTILYFPQFISGNNAGTELILVNNCTTEKAGAIVFYSSSNSTAEGDVIKVEPYSIPSRDVAVVSWQGYTGDPLKVGAVEITQEGSTSCKIEGTEFFNALGSYTTVMSAVLRNAQQIYALKNSTRDTGFAVYNPNDYTINIGVSFITSNDDVSASFSLGPKGHRAMFLSELFPTAPFNTPGTLNFIADGTNKFALVGLFTVDPATNALISLPTSPNAYLIGD